MEDIKQQVINVIERMRPYIQRDGGDITFSRLVDDVVYVNMHGACIGCIGLDSTLKDGVEAIILEEVPGISEVRLEENEYSLL